MTDTDKDELLRRARELGSKAAADSDPSINDSSAAERFASQNHWVIVIRKVFARILGVLGPLGRVLGWLFGLVGRWFKWAAYAPTFGEAVQPRFSIRWFFLNSGLTFVALVAMHVLLSAIYFYTTYFDETVYVTGKQEIETGELYQFGGCTSLPCSTESDNGKFYLIESSLYFPVMYYPEENVFANIPQQDAACHVEGYGIYFRTLRWLYKSVQLYQHVVDVSCRPYTEEEIRAAVQDGEIVRDE
jgi:hypothetical protein